MNKTTLKKILKVFLPAGSIRRKAAIRLARRLHIISSSPPDIAYAEWVERSEPFLWTDPDSVALNYEPLISIIVPVFNPPARHLLPMVYSVINQEFYENWELILINASTSKKAITLTEECGLMDTRIKIVQPGESRDIASNTNLGLQNATGDYVALLDHDDLLAPRALFEIAAVLQGKSRPKIIYSDEDKISENGKYRFDVHFKPEWSPQLFRQVNYLNHLMVIEKELIETVGGYRQGYEGAQDYDLFLRLIDKKPAVSHISKVLYHWRAARTSTASDISTKKNVLEAGEKALNDHLDRNKQQGKARALVEQPGFYDIVYKPRPSLKVAILLMPTSNIEQYSWFASRVLTRSKETSIQTEFFVGPTIEPLKSKNKNIIIKTISGTNHNNFIKQFLSNSNAEIVIFFNASAVPVRDSVNWLEDLSGLVSEVKSAGVVSPLLVQPPPNHKIFDAGYVLHESTTIPLFRGYEVNKHTYFGNTLWSRNVDYLSGRVCAMRRDIFEKYFGGKVFYSPHDLVNKLPFDKVHADDLELIIYPYTKMIYRGELAPSQYSTRYLNQNLHPIFYELGLTKNINIPPGDYI